MNRHELDQAQALAVRDSFARQSFMTTLGASLEVVEVGRVEISFSRNEDLLQQHGYLHAGVATAIVDSACGYSALTLAPRGSDVLTIEFKTSFLRPAAGLRFIARGSVVKPGRQVMFCEGEVWQLDSEERMVAKMSATMAIRHE